MFLGFTCRETGNKISMYFSGFSFRHEDLLKSLIDKGRMRNVSFDKTRLVWSLFMLLMICSVGGLKFQMSIALEVLASFRNSPGFIFSYFPSFWKHGWKEDAPLFMNLFGLRSHLYTLTAHLINWSNCALCAYTS